MADQQDGAAGVLGYVSQPAEDGPDLVGPVHVHVGPQERLHRVDDEQSGAVLSDGLFQPLVGEGQRLVAVVDDQHPVQVGPGLLKPGLYRVAQPVLGGLVDHVERLRRFHIGQRLSVGASRRQLHGEVGLALAGVALDDGQLPKGDVGKPQPVHGGFRHLAHADHGDRRFRFRLLQCDRLCNEFLIWNFLSVLQDLIPVLPGR